MKVLIINSTAGTGSTGNIVKVIEEGLALKGHQSIVCYGDANEHVNDRTHIKILPNWDIYLNAILNKIVGNGFGFNYYATFNIIRILKKFKPDIVQIFNPHAYFLNLYILLDYLKKNKIPTVYSMMDENAYTGTCFFTYNCEKYKNHCKGCTFKESYNGTLLFSQGHFTNKRKYKSYANFDQLWFVGGKAVITKAKESSLLKDKKLCQIEEPIELNKIFYPHDVTELRKQLHIPINNKVILTVTTLSNPRKGGRYFLDLYDKMKGYKGYSFVYVGFDTERYGIPEGLIKIPYVKSQDELASYYSLADVFVFTSLADTTPNTIIQALGCGSPICCFDIDGIEAMDLNDDVATLVPVGDVNALCKVILEKPKKNNDIVGKCCHSVEDYSSQKVFEHYLNLYTSISR